MNRIHAIAAAVCLSATAATAAEGAGPALGHVSHADSVKYVQVPNLPACFTNAVLDGDPVTGPSVFLVRSTGDCRVPSHWHTPVEQLMIVSGTARVTMKGQAPETLRAGSFARLPGRHVHEFACVGVCSFFVTSDGPFDIHYVDEQGREISFEEAMRRPAAAGEL
jgi:hypothetical protein